MRRNEDKNVKRKKSIMQTTFFFSSLLVVVTLSLSCLILVLGLPQYYKYYKKNSLKENAQSLSKNLESISIEKEIQKLLNDFSKQNNAQVWPYDKDDMLLQNYLSLLGTEYSVTNDDGKSNVSIMVENIEENKTNQKKLSIPDGANSSHFFNITQDVNGDSAIRRIEIVSSFQPIDEATDVIVSLIPYLMGIMLVIGLILAYFYSKKITRPILNLSRRTSRLTSGECALHEIDKIDVDQDEIGELSENIDQLYTRLNENIGRLEVEMEKVAKLEKNKTEFMRIAGHELKTPVTALSGILESMINNIGKYKNRDVYLIECKTIIDNMSILISDILAVSKLDIVETLPTNESVDLSSMIESSLKKFHYLSEEKDLKLYTDFESLILETDSQKMLSVVNNLLSNAVKYTVFNGKVIISISNGPSKQLIIENECDEIDADELDQFFEPFYTKDTSHSKRIEGTGLGLYIVQKNLDVLGFSYAAEKSKLGFKFQIIF